MNRTTDRIRPTLECLDRRDCPAVFGTAWPNPGLTLSFAPDGTNVNGTSSRLLEVFPDVTADVWQREILRAFQTWAEVANLNIGVVADGGQPVGISGPTQSDSRFGDIRIAGLPLGTAVAALGMPYDVAAGNRSGDIWFNSSIRFGVAGRSGFDLYSVALHEAGHALGIAGSEDPNSVMYQRGIRTRTGLSPDDVQAIVALYGPRPADRYEGSNGNDTLERATDARFRSDGFTRRGGDIRSAADVDVFEFRAEHLEGEGLTITVRTAGISLLAPRLEILDESGRAIASAVSGQTGSDLSIYLENLKRGHEYYARVRAGTDPVFDSGGYVLELRPDHVDDDDDGIDDPEEGLDDSRDTAGILPQSYTQTGPRHDYARSASLSTGTDVDFYHIRSPEGVGGSAGVLTATVWATTPGTEPVIIVTDYAGTVIPATVLVQDGGTYTLQIPATFANADYFVQVSHAVPGARALAGNYTLGVDFGGPAVPLATLGSGVLSSSATSASHKFAVAPGQVLHLVVAIDPASAPSTVKLTVLDSTGTTRDNRTATAGGFASLNVFLTEGIYQVRLTGQSNGSMIPQIRYSVQAASISDPVGPLAVDVTNTPLGPPPSPPTSPPPPPGGSTGPGIPPVPPIGSNLGVVPVTDRPIATVRPIPAPMPRTFSVVDRPGDSLVRSFNPDGSERFRVTPFAELDVPLQTAEADFTGDGVADLVVGSGPGTASHVIVLDSVTRQVLTSIQPFESSYTGGVNVSAGDVNGDGLADLVISPDRGGGPRVRIFNGDGFYVIADFFGIDDPNFRGGARTAVGDVNEDTVGDLIVSAGFGGGPRVAGFDGRSLGSAPVRLFGDFFAFEPGLRNGVNVAVGDLDGDGRSEVVAGAGPGGGPRVSAFNGVDLVGGPVNRTVDFFADSPVDRGGVRVAVRNLDGDAFADLVVGSSNRVATFNGSDLIEPSPRVQFELEVAVAAINGVHVG